jgi:hypothetical protein
VSDDPNQKALELFLKEWDGENPRISTLDAALRDARTTMSGGQARWLATLAYLVALEVVGSSVAKPSTKFPDRGNHKGKLMAGALEFSPDDSEDEIGEVLYYARCALAHDYGLQMNRYVFIFTASGPMITPAAVPWDRTLDGAKKSSMNTVLNIKAIGEYVEDIVATVRREFAAGGVVPAPRADIEAMQLFGGFYFRT